MVDMRVKIGAVTLQNPVMPASGCFSTDLAQVMDLNRLGALVAKTVSREYRAGNPPPRAAEVEGGMINSIGLPTKGIEYFFEHQVPDYQALHAAAGRVDFGNDHRGFRGDGAGCGQRRYRCAGGQYFLPDARSQGRQFRAPRRTHLRGDETHPRHHR